MFASFFIFDLDKVCYGLRQTLLSLAAGALQVLIVGKVISMQTLIDRELLSDFTEFIQAEFSSKSDITLNEVFYC